MRHAWIVAVIVLVGCRSKAEKEAYEAKRQALVAQLDAEAQGNAAAEKAKLDATRKACKLKSDAGSFLEEGALERECRQIVTKAAKVPNSVEFGFSSPEPFSTDGCVQEYGLAFKSKNALGLEVPGYVKCTFDPRDGKIGWKFDKP